MTRAGRKKRPPAEIRASGFAIQVTLSEEREDHDVLPTPDELESRKVRASSC
jgi:hypothetical protein